MKAETSKSWGMGISLIVWFFFFLTCLIGGEGQSEAFTYVKSWGTQPLIDGQVSLVSAVALDASGNVYISDGVNNRIQKFDSTSGAFLTKWGSYGTGNGQFKYPCGLAVDASGNVYVADGGNNRIQVFDSSGTYLRQVGSPGNGNGQLSFPRAIAIDGAGNIYVIESGNNRVQKFDSSGNYITKWGSYGSGNGQFNSPFGLAVDTAGNVYVADTYNNRIQKFDASGTFLTKWGSFGSGNLQFNSPRSVFVDGSGNVYVSDYGNNRILKFDSLGNYITQYGSMGFVDPGKFASPQGLAVDGAGLIYAGDIANHRIQIFQFNGDGSATFIAQRGTFTSGDGQLNFPRALARDNSGNFYVADRCNHRIQKFDSAGNYVTQWGSMGSGEGQFYLPHGIAVDGSGNVYVSDTNNNRIQKFDSGGTYLGQWGVSGSGNGQFNKQQGIAIDGSGNIYVVDTGNNRIQVFDSSGNYLAQWGSFGTDNGNFNAPGNIAIDGSGNIFVADTNNYRIQVFTYAGGIATFQYKWGSYGSGDGQFTSPWGIASDGSGNVYVTDINNHSIQKFSTMGNFILRYANWGMGDRQFFYPYGLVVDGSGNVYVADSVNQRIQELAPSAISGQVTSDGTTGIPGVSVLYCDSTGYCYGSTTTDSNGNYTLAVAAGSWKVSFNPPQGGYYLRQWYNNKTDSTTADLVTVTAGSSTTGINAQLTMGGAISGKVTSDGTNGIANVSVGYCDSTGYCYGWMRTDGSGNYTLNSVPAGSWRVQFYTANLSGYYLPQWYNNQSSLNSADLVTVAAGSTTPNINAQLATGGAISGKVTSDGTTGIGGVWVSYCDQNGYCFNGTSTDVNGNYTLNAPAGSWKIRFNPPQGAGYYLSEWYNGQASPTTATEVTVTAGATTPNINAQLVQGGAISGKVTSDGTTGIANVSVGYCDSTGYCFNWKNTDVNGNYTLNAPAGSWKIRFNPPQGAGYYLSEWYNGQASPTTATEVTVTAGSTTPNINAQLATGGAISGKVTTDGITGIAGVFVNACDQSGDCSYAGTSTDSNGNYSLIAPAGNWKVMFNPSNAGGYYLWQWYNGKSSSAMADSVTVTAGQITSGINAQLVQGGAISGRVTNAQGAGVANADVGACDVVTGNWLYGTRTDNNGNYTINVPAGNWKVMFNPWVAIGGYYLGKWYDDKANSISADVVTVTAGSTTSGINAQLTAGGAISGRVTNAQGDGVANADVGACDVMMGTWLYGTRTDSSGNYTIIVPAGTWKVQFNPWVAIGGYYLGKWYDDKADSITADTVTVTAGEITAGINAQLVTGGAISGKVTSDGTTGIANVNVGVLDGDGNWLNGTITDAFGNYSIIVPAGAYKVYFNPMMAVGGNYQEQWYNGKSSLAEADTASVTTGQTTSGINAQLLQRDVAAPTLSITSHTNNQQVSTASITLSGTASDGGLGDNGIQQVTINGNRADNDTAAGSGTINWSKTITLALGANTIAVIAYDNSPNHNQTTQQIQITYAPPKPLSRHGDYDGDGKTDIAVWRPGDGNWYIRNSATGTVTAQQWGMGSLNDWPVPGDYDGEGKIDYGVWRPGDGMWYILRSSDGGVTAIQWGAGSLNDVPVPGDYDGDGKTDPAVWRPGDGNWYILRSSDGGVTATQWGAGSLNDLPVPGDYDGDGKTDMAVWRPGDGNWYIRRSFDGSITSTQWGTGTLFAKSDIPVPGDYDGDGKTDMAVWRPGDGMWYILRSSDGGVTATQWGTGTLFTKSDIPVPGDYDGDGKTDIAVWRPGDGMWYILRSSDGGVTATQWGSGDLNDEPIAGNSIIYRYLEGNLY